MGQRFEAVGRAPGIAEGRELDVAFQFERRILKRVAMAPAPREGGGRDVANARSARCLGRLTAQIARRRRPYFPGTS